MAALLVNVPGLVQAVLWQPLLHRGQGVAYVQAVQIQLHLFKNFLEL